MRSIFAPKSQEVTGENNITIYSSPPVRPIMVIKSWKY